MGDHGIGRFGGFARAFLEHDILQAARQGFDAFFLFIGFQKRDALFLIRIARGFFLGFGFLHQLLLKGHHDLAHLVFGQQVFAVAEYVFDALNEGFGIDLNTLLLHALADVQPDAVADFILGVLERELLRGGALGREGHTGGQAQPEHRGL